MQIENAGKIPREEILRLAGLEGRVNSLSVDIEKIKSSLEAYSSIHAATVSKILPDTIRISITPEVPIAIVNGNALHYINSQGKIYDRVHAGDALNLPLIHLEGGEEAKEKSPERVAQAVEIVRWVNQSRLISTADIGDILVRGPGYDGKAPIEMTLAFPPNALRNGEKPRYLMVSFSDDNLPKQMQRLEVVVNELVQRHKSPTKIRMELDKKVVVKIAQ